MHFRVTFFVKSCCEEFITPKALWIYMLNIPDYIKKNHSILVHIVLYVLFSVGQSSSLVAHCPKLS